MMARAENDEGPNYLGYYKHMVLKLLSGSDELLLPFSDSESLEKCSEGGDKLFANGIVTGISDFQMERLKGFLDQSISALTHDTDEMCKEIYAKVEMEAGIKENGVPAFSDNESSCDDLTRRFRSFSKVYKDFQGFLQDGLCPKEALEECSKSISEKLGMLERNLEELLDAAISKCRPMTDAEKQMLGQRIFMLPRKALDRVVEIVKKKKSLVDDPSLTNVNLEEEDDATLWRLYVYVEMVRKANRKMKSGFCC